MRKATHASEHKSQIAVVGAGLAGLTAAYRLQEKGYDVQVYEARQRSGGRVFTANVGEGHEELGGKNFLDGGDPVHSLHLMQDLNLKPLYYEIPFEPLYVSETEVTPFFELLKYCKNSKALYSEMKEIAVHAQNLQEVIDGVFKDPLLRSRFTAAIKSYEGSDPKTLDAMVFSSLYVLFSIFYEGLQKREEGLLPTYTWLTVEGGNGKLPIALAEKLKDRIHYGHPLKAVQSSNQEITLVFKESYRVQADLVLLAIPCSVFEDIHFDEKAMPIHTLKSIQKVQYGTNAKILFPFSIPAHSYKVLSSPTVFCWSNENDRVRTFYYGGENGIFDAHNVQSFFEQGTQMVQRAFPNIAMKSYTLESAKDRQYASYEEGVYISWVYDSYAKGSYANYATGTYTWLSEMVTIHGEKVRKVFSPIHEKIFFAGEHTTTLDAFGTLEGAIESGERMARLIDKTVQGKDN